MGIFDTAVKNKKTKSTAKSKKDNIVILPEGDISVAVKEFCAAKAAEKQAAADAKIAQATAKPDIMMMWFKDFASKQTQPETMKFRTKDGKATVTLIVQDKGERYDVKPDQEEILTQLLGDEKAEESILRTTIFSFDPVLMSRPAVMKELGSSIEKAIKKLVKEKTLTEAESGELLAATQKVTVRKGTLAKLAALGDNDPDQMEQVFDGLGSHVSGYLKASG